MAGVMASHPVPVRSVVPETGVATLVNLLVRSPAAMTGLLSQMPMELLNMLEYKSNRNVVGSPISLGDLTATSG